MITSQQRQAKIPRSQRQWSLILVIAVAVISSVVAWRGLEAIAKYVLWGAGVLGVCLAVYFSILRYRD